MNAQDIKRELRAILSADAVGYTRLMAADEVATVQRIKTYRELISVRVKEHRGRVVDTPGDNILAEFPSALDAVRCAVEIQRVLKTRNDDLPTDQKMEFRIGVHLGDVMVDGDRIYGDGVNIAARLENLADPGGICISEMVHGLVKGKLGIDFEDLGEQQVKNVPDPVHAFAVSLSQRPSVTVSDDTTPSPSPSKATIAVLAFENMSSDPEQEFLCEGISEDILNGLAKNPGLGVIARTSSFSFKGRNQDIRSIGKQLNATHVLEGSIRKAGDRIRVTAQLNATGTGMHLWSDQYNRELADIFEMQDEIAAAILKELNIRLLATEDEQIRTHNMEAYAAYLLGRYQRGLQQLDSAVLSFERAISHDPTYADAYGILALEHIMYLWWSQAPAREKLPTIRNCIDRALSLNPNQPDALSARTQVLFYDDRAYQDAINACDDLIQNHPNNAEAHWNYAYILQAIKHYDLASAISERYVEMDPLSPLAHTCRYMTYLCSRRIDKARQSLREMESLGMREPGLFALLSFLEGDIDGIQKRISQDRSNWGNVGYLFPLLEAVVARSKGKYEKAREILRPIIKNHSSRPFVKSRAALIAGDIDLSFDFYTQALAESEFTAFRLIHAPLFYLELYPQYRSDPKHQKMLKDVGLDEESIAKLEIPPLPF